MSSCEMCKHLINYEKNPERGGFCVRYPPQVAVAVYPCPNGQMQTETFYEQPCVTLNDVCGEFASKEVPT